MRVLIIEPRHIGHHGPYLRWMVRELMARGWQVILFTSRQAECLSLTRELVEQASRTSTLSVVFADSDPLDCSAPVRSMFKLIKQEFKNWRWLRQGYKRCLGSVVPDVVFLPYADYCLNAIGLIGSPFGKCPFIGIAMRPAFHYHEMGIRAPAPRLQMIKRWLFRRVLFTRELKTLFVIDEPLFQYTNSKDWGFGKIAFFNEPAELAELESNAAAKQTLGVPIDRSLILVYGAITGRKGIESLLNAMKNPEFPLNVDVMIAGRFAVAIGESSLKHLQANSAACTRIHIINRFIESKEEATLFAAADMVWLGYKGHYNSSGVLQQAAVAHRPVLACSEGIIGWRTTRYGLGVTLDPDDVDSIVKGVRSLLRGSADIGASGRRRSWRPATFHEAGAELSAALASGGHMLQTPRVLS